MKQQQGKDVSLTGVRKVYGDVIALLEVNLSVGRGEFCTLLGAFGSG